MHPYFPARLGVAAVAALMALAACQSETPTAPADARAATRMNPLQSAGKIAFSAHFEGSREIYTVRPDGSAYTRVTNHPDLDSHPAWVGSQRLVFIREPSYSADVDLYFINPDGSGEAPVSPGQLVDVWQEMWPAVSPDGSKIAFQSAGDVYVMNSTGAGRVKLTTWGGYDGEPTWSPDGSRIAFTSDRDGDLEIWIMNADGSNPVQLTHNGMDDYAPDWSPKGGAIAFTLVPPGGGWDEADIWVIKPDGSGLTQLTNDPISDRYPSFSPDGHRIAFVSDRTGHGDIYTIKVNGTDLQQVTATDQQEDAPAWSR